MTFLGISRWLLQRYIHWGKWRRGALSQVACTFCRMAMVMGGWREGRWRAPSNKCTMTYHDEEKNLVSETSPFFHKKHWSWRSEAFDEMIVCDVRHSQNWHVEMFERLVNWYSPQLVRESFSMNRMWISRPLLWFTTGYQKKQDWDLFGVLPFWSSIGRDASYLIYM